MDTKLTLKSREALTVAIRQAAAVGNPQVETAHLLAALLDIPEGTTVPLLKTVGADPQAIRRANEERLERLPKASGSTVPEPRLSGQLQRVLNTAQHRAEELEDEYVSTEQDRKSVV